MQPEPGFEWLSKLRALDAQTLEDARVQSPGAKIAECIALAELCAQMAAGSTELPAILRSMREEEEQENRLLDEINHGYQR